MKLPIYGPRLRKVARKHFGWPALRPGQFKPMRAVLRRRDVNLRTAWLITLVLLALGLLGTFSPFFELFAPEE